MFYYNLQNYQNVENNENFENLYNVKALHSLKICENFFHREFKISNQICDFQILEILVEFCDLGSYFRSAAIFCRSNIFFEILSKFLFVKTVKILEDRKISKSSKI